MHEAESQKGATEHVYGQGSRVSELSHFASDAFERDVTNAVDAALMAFKSECHGRSERLFQIAIWTDVSSKVTGVSIETREHARKAIDESASYWRSRNDEETAREIESIGYNSSPADFRHHSLATVTHAQQVWSGSLEEIDSLVEASLQSVVDRLIAKDVLADVPLDTVAWIGTSSPRDWLDHVRRIR